ncbi:MAG: hypothetical protein VX246_15355 [Myxococcota bacterium]|nr:hypothetical protein [Myxococcota bacterium]
MNDASSTQGWAICIAVGVLALLFVLGVLGGSYVAIAIPVSILTLFVLGLAGWVGYTIATVQVEPALQDEPIAPATADADEDSSSATSA